jgi:hypothetical protein
MDPAGSGWRMCSWSCIVGLSSTRSCENPVNSRETMILGIRFTHRFVPTRLNKGSDEYGVPYKNALDVVVRQCKKGLSGFYAGVQVTCLESFGVAGSLPVFVLMAWDHLKTGQGVAGCDPLCGILLCVQYSETPIPQVVFLRIVFSSSALKRTSDSFGRRFGKISMAANLLLGYIAATVNLTITMPVEVCSTASLLVSITSHVATTPCIYHITIPSLSSPGSFHPLLFSHPRSPPCPSALIVLVTPIPLLPLLPDSLRA